MYKLVILCSVLGALLQMANSLKCYDCRDEYSCKNASTVECNHTNALLNIYQITKSTKFSCYVGVYTSGGKVVSDVRGCILTNAITCDTPPSNPHWVQKTCNVCSEDLCNDRNSVGTISASAAVMIGVLFVAKLFLY
ncbi:uncharacterized protein LOC131803682 [Musca domestica]|uniref:Uncharacterized protein LOC101889164 n=1 Tax=Musca domestica TaxID=7370 RepID=A0A1I8MMN4_MUSDO|nr:uncharacterized protein LOC101889164 [Musca domestica]XP_058981155.1 uncharacterized protein LOC131803682 [Musca domestica]